MLVALWIRKGLVKLRRMGVEVLGLEEFDLHELYEVQFLLENFCLQKVTEDFDENMAAKYYRILEEMEASMKPTKQNTATGIHPVVPVPLIAVMIVGAKPATMKPICCL